MELHIALQNWVGLNDVIGVEAGSRAGCLLAEDRSIHRFVIKKLLWKACVYSLSDSASMSYSCVQLHDSRGFSV